jgi:hypothetical protein
LRIAGRAVPAQVAPLGQLKFPAILMATVKVPGDPESVIVPKSRFCFAVRVSDFTTFALAWIVVEAACACAKGAKLAKASTAIFQRRLGSEFMGGLISIQPASLTACGKKAVNQKSLRSFPWPDVLAKRQSRSGA